MKYFIYLIIFFAIIIAIISYKLNTANIDESENLKKIQTIIENNINNVTTSNLSYIHINNDSSNSVEIDESTSVIKELPDSISNLRLGMKLSRFNEIVPHTSQTSYNKTMYYKDILHPIFLTFYFHFKSNMSDEIEDYKKYLHNEYSTISMQDIENMDLEEQKSMLDKFNLLQELEMNQSLEDQFLNTIRLYGNLDTTFDEVKKYIFELGKEDEKHLYVKNKYDSQYIKNIMLLVWNRNAYKISFTYAYNFELDKFKFFEIRYTIPNFSNETYFKDFKIITTTEIEENNEYSQLYNQLNE